MSSEFGLLDLRILQKNYRLKAITMLPKNPKLIMSKYFPESKSDTNLVEWETSFQYAGLAQYVDKGGMPNQVGEDPTVRSWQEVAYKVESYWCDADDVRWQRKPGTDDEESMTNKILQQKLKMAQRLDNRNEWENICALRGSVAIKTTSGSTVTLDYGLPSGNKIDITGESGSVWTNVDSDLFGMLRTWAEKAGLEEADIYCPTYIIDVLAKHKQITGYFGENLKTIIATHGRVQKVYGFDIIPYNATYAKDFNPDSVNIPARERFMAKNEIFILPKDETIGERPIAACAKSGGKSQRFVRAWEEKEHKDGTWLVVGEYSLPVIRNKWSHIYAKVCAAPQ